MKAVEEWMLWYDEKTANLNRQKGMHPRVERVHGYNTKLFYCYYTPSADADETDESGLYVLIHMHIKQL